MIKILLCAVLVASGLNAEETTERTLLKRLVSRIPNSNMSLTKLAERVGESLKETVNKMSSSNTTLVKLADRVDSGVKKMVDTLRPSGDTLHALGERVMDGLRGLVSLLPTPSSVQEPPSEKDKSKKPFALDIKIPHIFSLQLSRSKGEGGRLGLSVLRPLLDLNISRRKKEKEEGLERKEDTDLGTTKEVEESNETKTKNAVKISEKLMSNR